MTDFQVGKTYEARATGGQALSAKVIDRIVISGGTEISIVTQDGLTHSLEVMWCDLAGSECAEMPQPEAVPLYATQTASRQDFS